MISVNVIGINFECEKFYKDLDEMALRIQQKIRTKIDEMLISQNHITISHHNYKDKKIII